MREEARKNTRKAEKSVLLRQRQKAIPILQMREIRLGASGLRL
jgi:hypothetical protein